MKYTEKQWQELANKVALFKQLEEEIDAIKSELRKVENDNELTNQFIYVKRSKSSKTIYPTEYTIELKKTETKLKEKYANKIIIEEKPHYKIELIPLKQAQIKADIITNEVMQMSNTQTKRMVASQKSKTATKQKRGV